MKFNLMTHVLSVVMIVALAGCDIRLPSSRTDIPDERPSIAFTGAPEGSVVYVDGQEMGSAFHYSSGRNVLLVEPGNHLIRVRLGDRILFNRHVFLSGLATKTFVVK